MSARAWAYLWAVILVACGVVGIILWNPHPFETDWGRFAMLLLLAILSQYLEVKYGRHSYYPHFLPFFAGVVLLSPAEIVLLVSIPHLIEWISKQFRADAYAWYIQPFNISTHILASLASYEIYTLLGGEISQLSFVASILAPAAAILTYATINHLLIGQILVLARGISWAESEIMSIEALSTDGLTMSTGYVCAILWSVNPWLMLPALAPFFIIRRALRVPVLERQAFTDSKTGLWNNSYFQQNLSEAISQAAVYNTPLSVIMADMDLLRQVNNTYGHLAGDKVICAIAEILSQSIGKRGIVARFGGEEFAIMLPEVGLQDAVKVAEQIRQQIEKTATAISDYIHIHATISVGVACYPQDGSSPNEMIEQADIALYQAKLRGRNRVVSTHTLRHLGHPLTQPIQQADLTQPLQTSEFWQWKARNR